MFPRRLCHTAATLFTLLALVVPAPALAHEYHAAREAEARAAVAAERAEALAAERAAAFARFAPFVRTRSDAQYLYIESDGLPNHQMMVGITNWQQQVPLPQNFSGTNIFRLPLAPALSSTPFTFTQQPLLNAVALAVNGVPIFTALNNRGEDSLLIGELDAWGGHCGRADDYHYHIAPLHLAEIVGPAAPIAFALDGFAIYGLTEPDGSAVGALDAYNGHLGADGSYHYHATRAFPYINGGFRGVVDVSGGQANPQPRTTSPRPATNPLNGAVITGFSSPAPDMFMLRYTVAGRTSTITTTADRTRRTVRYVFTDANGVSRTENYSNWSAPPAIAGGEAHLTNLSVRTIAGAGERTLIQGFALAGTGTKPIVARAIGPTLAALGVAAPLADPRLTLFDSSAPRANNDNWSGSDGREAGAFPLPAGSRDAVLVTTLGTGAFTAQLTSADTSTGEALAEIYDAAPANAALRLSNLSTRANLERGQRLIVGFVLGGTGARTVLLRAIGPGLASFGLANTLPDPRLALYEGNVLVTDSDDWGTPAENGGNATLAALAQSAGAFPLAIGSRDAAAALTLRPGAYTLHVQGDGSAGGVVLIEVYALP